MIPDSIKQKAEKSIAYGREVSRLTADIGTLDFLITLTDEIKNTPLNEYMYGQNTHTVTYKIADLMDSFIRSGAEPQHIEHILSVLKFEMQNLQAGHTVKLLKLLEDEK